MYWRVQYALDLNLNNSLAEAAAALAPRVTRSGQLPVDSATLARVDGFQILDSQGDVLDYDAPLGSTIALYPVTLRRALAPSAPATGNGRARQELPIAWSFALALFAVSGASSFVWLAPKSP